MSGHMGDVTRTVQNLDVVRVDAERGLLMVRALSRATPAVMSSCVRLSRRRPRGGVSKWISSS